jgi:crossover junction endodeoxyribonuclease RuvC
MMAAAREMMILGVDPGLQQTGLGSITVRGHAVELGHVALLTTRTSAPLAGRLDELFDGMQKALREWKPDVVVVERLIYARNAQVALKLGHARGVLLLAAAREGIQIAEYTPAEVKRAVTGNGSASKEQVQRMVKAIVQTSRLHLSFDVTDALALAICHAHRAALRGRLPAPSRFPKQPRKRTPPRRHPSLRMRSGGGAGGKTGATFLARA